ncbi:SCO2524 family protein [Streptomyces krungchingensis]|uniref:SCO2524 family protein n=1 Tax=Streptomyces krungchingensis TaxID=1565034 RepID=UPI003CF3E1A3
MRIKPRQHLLDVWRAMARNSFDGGEWSWGKWGGLSSVADAERLLCLMYPATEIPGFRLDDPDLTQDDVVRALEGAGGRTEIPVLLMGAVADFMRAHTGHDGRPTFAGGHYFASEDGGRELTAEQREVEVVDSYSMSVTLCLATLGFLRVYGTNTARRDVLHLIEELRNACGKRLTAAMVGLLRSFTVKVFDEGSPEGRTLCELLGQGQLPARLVPQKFQRRFRALRTTLGEDLFLGVDVHEALRDEGRLFECGWAWSLVKDAPRVDVDTDIGVQPDGIAAPAPHLHFTVVALDGIQDLFSDRTLTLGLLDGEQQRLAEALRLRWEITQRYWSGVARFTDERWPLEDIPWRTTGRQLESSYLSLSVAAILVQDLVRRRATDEDLTRTVAVMERLADRGRITTRMTREDAALALHRPGVALPLEGSEALGPSMRWTMTDFSAQLLKRTVQLCALSRNLPAYDRLVRLAEHVFEHVWQRRMTEGEGAGLWDDVQAVYPEAPRQEDPPSWAVTERVTECMVAAHHLYEQNPIRSAELASLARGLLSEATHLLGREQLQAEPTAGGQRGRALKRAEVTLRRADRILDELPGTAYALTVSVLSELDALAQARHDGQGV